MKKIVVTIIIGGICGGGIYYFWFFKKNHDFSDVEKMVRDFQALKDREVQTQKFIDIDKDEAKRMIESGELKPVDVSSDYKKGHLPNALNCYLGDGSLDKVVAVLDKNDRYLVYSINDESSITGSQKLINNGFKNVYRLNGNLESWKNANFPMEFDFLSSANLKGSGKVIKSFDSETNEYSYLAKIKLDKLKDKEFYQAFFFKSKPQESFNMGTLSNVKDEFVMTYKSAQDFSRFDNFVVILSNEGDAEFQKEKIVAEAQINNFR